MPLKTYPLAIAGVLSVGLDCMRHGHGHAAAWCFRRAAELAAPMRTLVADEAVPPARRTPAACAPRRPRRFERSIH